MKTGAEKSFSTLTQAEQIVQAAKVVQRRRRRVKLTMQKAQIKVRQAKLEKEQEIATKRKLESQMKQ